MKSSGGIITSTCLVESQEVLKRLCEHAWLEILRILLRTTVDQLAVRRVAKDNAVGVVVS